MSKVLADPESVQEARVLRMYARNRLAAWNPDVTTEEARNIYLAKLLNHSFDKRFMFWMEGETYKEHSGVERHVLEGLRQLTGPNGYTVYRLMLIKHKERLTSA